MADLIRAADAYPEAPLSRIRLTAAQAHVLLMAAEVAPAKLPLARVSSADTLVDFGLVKTGNYPMSASKELRHKPWAVITDRGKSLVKRYNAGHPRKKR